MALFDKAFFNSDISTASPLADFINGINTSILLLFSLHLIPSE
jgi:hypothetical protein